jgi:hypothetical protein
MDVILYEYMNRFELEEFTKPIEFIYVPITIDTSTVDFERARKAPRDTTLNLAN